MIMRRYNQRLFRVVRGILRDENETEEVIQDAYVRAYEHLDQFEGRSKFSTWLTKIAVYDAYARLRGRERVSETDERFWQDLTAASARSASCNRPLRHSFVLPAVLPASMVFLPCFLFIGP